MKINDIIGKAWLSSLDDSEGYVLSFKLIEQNNLSSVPPEKEQEAKSTVQNSLSPISLEKEEGAKSGVTVTNSPNTSFPENSQEEEISNNNFNKKKELLYEIKKYFKKYPQKLSFFVNFIKEHGKKIAEYKELSAVNPKTESNNNSINDKIRNIMILFREDLSRLRYFFEDFKDSN